MSIPQKDVSLVRDLAKRVAEIAALPVQQEKAAMWMRHNGLDRVRPLVLVQCAPEMWRELMPDSELQTGDEFCRSQEKALRQTLYAWDHMRDDRIVTDLAACPIAFRDSGFGIAPNPVRPDHAFGAKHFQTVIEKESDIERIQTPRITVDWTATEARYQRLTDLYDGILRIEKQGMQRTWFALMDQFIQWRGLERMFMDLMERPEWIHQVMERMTQGWMARFDQLESQGLLSLNNGANWVASGGMGMTDELPQPDFDGSHVRCIDLWGHATTQIFTNTISPATHEEFALQYERRFLARFGLNCYGCCEPLDGKLDIVKTIPRLRRVSMSPWIDPARGAEGLGADYIFSYKPNPAIVSMDHWDVDLARVQLRNVLEKTRGCVVEAILKDLHTCRNEPRRMWEWTAMAMQLAEEYA